MHTIAWQIQYDLLLAIPWGEKEHTHTPSAGYVATPSKPQNTENQRVCLHSIQQSPLLWKKNKVEPKELLHQHLINYKDTRQNMRQMDVHSTSFNHL